MIIIRYLSSSRTRDLCRLMVVRECAASTDGKQPPLLAPPHTETNVTALQSQKAELPLIRVVKAKDGRMFTLVRVVHSNDVYFNN